MKKSILLIAGISLSLAALSFRANAQTDSTIPASSPASTPAATPSPAPTPSTSTTASPSETPAGEITKKQHKDINEYLDQHPTLKEKVLEKFDLEHTGKLMGKQLKAFKKWIKENREDWKQWKKEYAKGGRKHSSAATPTPAVSPH